LNCVKRINYVADKAGQVEFLTQGASMNVAAEQPDGPTRALHELTALKSAQLALLGVLIEKSSAVATMYVGALMARADDSNPDRLSQACHSLRELIDNLPKYFDVPVEPAGRLGDHVNALHDRWKREPRVINGNSDPLTEKFARKLFAFFKWKDENFPKRQEVARRTIRDLDASGRILPQPIENLRASEWMAIRDFFVNSTHHGSCSLEDFDGWLDVFETFMLGLTKPRTFDNADAIDALIQEGESNG